MRRDHSRSRPGETRAHPATVSTSSGTAAMRPAQRHGCGSPAHAVRANDGPDRRRSSRRGLRRQFRPVPGRRTARCLGGPSAHCCRRSTGHIRGTRVPRQRKPVIDIVQERGQAVAIPRRGRDDVRHPIRRIQPFCIAQPELRQCRVLVPFHQHQVVVTGQPRQRDLQGKGRLARRSNCCSGPRSDIVAPARNSLSESFPGRSTSKPWRCA